jgi:hypothetical protein
MASILMGFLASAPGLAETTIDPKGIVIDGSTQCQTRPHLTCVSQDTCKQPDGTLLPVKSEWSCGESIFGADSSFSPPRAQESDIDSRWQDNDIAQIRVTWDADSVYAAVDGVINGNNVMVLFDVANPNPTFPIREGRVFNGISEMTSLNSWRRNFFFAGGFFPDFFVATWDFNTSPRLLTATGPNTVIDEISGGSFRAAATFQGTQPGRSMEFSLPWARFLETRQILGRSVPVLPPGVRFVRIVGVVTGGNDGTGGPDSAPDNLQGHTVDGAAEVIIDNFAILDLDADEDRVPDFFIEPRDQVSYLVNPPVLAPGEFGFEDFAFDRPSFSPERGQDLNFRFDIKRPRLEEELPFFTLSATIYDMKGNLVRRLYDKEQRPLNDPASRTGRWDGKNTNGQFVQGGVYIFRLILEPYQIRLNRAVAVAR